VSGRTGKIVGLTTTILPDIVIRVKPHVERLWRFFASTDRLARRVSDKETLCRHSTPWVPSLNACGSTSAATAEPVAGYETADQSI
jgi:hypothetical protein